MSPSDKEARKPLIVFLLSFAFILFLLAQTASSATWIVDDDGGSGVDFTDIPPAISAAAPGDLILVRAGAYSGFQLDKALAIAADTGHQPSINGLCTITAIGPGQSAVLSGFDIYRLLLEHAEGSLVIDDCTCIEGYGNAWSLAIDDCDLVKVSRCHWEKTYMGFAKPTALIKDSTAIVSESAFVGQEGYDNLGVWTYAEDGGPGLRAENSTLYFLSSSSRGGDGGTAYELIEPDPAYGGLGAPAIDLQYSTLHLFGTVDQVIEGGSGGWSWYSWKYSKSASAVVAKNSKVFYSGVTFKVDTGLPFIENQGSLVSEISPEVPVILLDGSGEIGDYIRITLHGPPQSSYTIFFSPYQTALPMGNLYTHLLLDPGHLFFFVSGKIPAGLPPSYTIHVPPQASDLQGMPVHFQAYVVTSLGMPYLSTSAAFVVR